MSELKFNPPRFAPKKGQPFYQELTFRVNAYFKSEQKSKKGNFGLFFKTFILIVGIISAYLALVLFQPNFSIAWMIWAIMGVLISAIGFNTMHDGAHGSFSKYNWLNEMAAHTVNFLGASVLMWKTKHNAVHHTFTNIEGVDDDIESGSLLRMSPGQKKLWIHKFQHVYFSALYALLYIYWVLYTDYKKYFSKKIGQVPLKRFSAFQHISFWAWKALHLGLFVGIPMMKLGFMHWIIGFLIMSAVAGFALSIVFQMAHVVDKTDFISSNSREAIETEDEWAIHQMKTTANFAMGNKFLTWFLGGLNYQVEHHLFPRISHVHYPDISKIVKATCEEFNITYIEFKTFASAYRSHVNHLKQMGLAEV